jgi:hypothetical protein
MFLKQPWPGNILKVWQFILKPKKRCGITQLSLFPPSAIAFSPGMSLKSRCIDLTGDIEILTSGSHQIAPIFVRLRSIQVCNKLTLIQSVLLSDP